MKILLAGLLVSVVACGGGGGMGDDGSNTGMSSFTGMVSGAAMGNVSGTVDGTSAVTGSSGTVLAMAQPVTLPAGLRTLSMSLYFNGAITAKTYSGSDFFAAAVAASLPDLSQYGASLSSGAQGFGTVTATITSIDDNGVFVTVKGTVDATMPASGSATGSITLHLTM